MDIGKGRGLAAPSGLAASHLHRKVKGLNLEELVLAVPCVRQTRVLCPAILVIYGVGEAIVGPPPRSISRGEIAAGRADDGGPLEYFPFEQNSDAAQPVGK